MYTRIPNGESEEIEGADYHNTYGTSEEERAKIIENQIRENDLKESKVFMRDISHAGSAIGGITKTWFRE